MFLPLWDAYPLGWRDRTRVVEPRFAPWVYDAAGNTTSIIVEEGRCIGLWQFRDGDSITLEFHIFEPYANRLNAVRLAAETHAAQLAIVAGARDVRVVERALPQALTDRPAASFLWPLGKEPVFRLSDSDYDNPMDRRERQPNVLRSKFLDDERLVRPVDEPERPRHNIGHNIGLGDKKPPLKGEAPKPAPVPQDKPATSSSAPAVKKTVHVAPSKKKAAKPAQKKPAATRAAAPKKSAPKKKKH
jgi:hypothetical protein